MLGVAEPRVPNPVEPDVPAFRLNEAQEARPRETVDPAEDQPMLRVLITATAAAALLGAPALAQAQQHPSMTAIDADSLKWGPLQPPGFDAGMEIAVMHGDPSVADAPYTVRLRFSDGYRFPAHYHPNAENVTVLSGRFLLGMGRSEGGQLTTYMPGDYIHIPATQPHYGGTRGATVIQLHGVGPFEVLLANPVATRPDR
jgi:quercetin dioxygenase-like cupin family protein